jgi:NAD+ kinase
MLKAYVHTKDKDQFYIAVITYLKHCGVLIVDTAPKADFSVILGGDGTVLAAGRSGIKGPVLIINTGHLGFLTSSTAVHYKAAINDFIAGLYTTTKRYMLTVDLLDVVSGLVVRKKPKFTVVKSFKALNDLVIKPTAMNKLVHMTVYASCDGKPKELMCEYRADGLIVSTSTGSTAYNLSAGGPIIHPSCESFVITPICPQGLTHRPVVLPASYTLHISEFDPGLYISIDGQVNEPLEAQVVSVKYGKACIEAVNPPETYFQVLRQKLHWGNGIV